MFAAIKGVRKPRVKDVGATNLQEVGLSDYDSDRLVARCSDGMKRRPSFACSTIGQPQVVFLDDWSAGVDPMERHEVSQLLSDIWWSAAVCPCRQCLSLF